MKSRIHLNEAVENAERRFGSAQVYYPAVIIMRDGERRHALFTPAQVRDAVERAGKNPEDVPKENLLSRWLG